MKNIYAHTDPSHPYPEYISVNEVEEGVTITVRNKPDLLSTMGYTAIIYLTYAQFAELCGKGLAFVDEAS